jgi:hypothetical protein
MSSETWQANGDPFIGHVRDRAELPNQSVGFMLRTAGQVTLRQEDGGNPAHNDAKST